ncbi:MAG TPA: CDP-diacylglycerol--glycerol-3-phosphate 3-phosphatidyltransferase [Erysipelotrichaceae bacterium]|nr:CDP-diacylglycerol--glycerol-3-phosphate 3-phosphatidyltransferase [Erysipelotrichaceae bacterium]
MNLPNRLTVIRIMMIPIIILVYIFPYAQFNINIPVFYIKNLSISLINIVVLILFLIASFTDYLDGYIARKNNLITTFGKFADPIADKLLVNSLYILFVSKGIIPVVPIIIMVARDTIVDGCRMMAAQSGVVVAAGYLGKLKTVLQMLSIIFILLNNIPFEFIRIPISDITLWFATFVSMSSGYSHFNQLKEFIFESK